MKHRLDRGRSGSPVSWLGSAGRKLATALFLLGASALLAACGDEPAPAAVEQPSEWHRGDGYRWRELALPDGEAVGFTSLPVGETGVNFSNELTTEQAIHNENLGNGSGVALGDVDGDGRVDVYLARLDGPNALYRNLGGWRFEEVTGEAGVGLPESFSTGAVLADVDGDGDLDLLVGVYGDRNRLFLNDGAGRFRDATESSGLTGEQGTTTMALADVDGDGDLDLYVTNYKTRPARDIYPPSELAFSSVVEKEDGRYRVAPEFRDHYRLAWKGGEVRYFELAEADRFYLNDGSGHFLLQPFTDGRFLDREGEPLREAPREWGLAARFQDVDRDGDPDLYVANDLQSPDHFWINDGTGRFRMTSVRAIRTTSNSTMALDFSDIDRDGHVDFLEVDMLSRSSGLRKRQKSTIVRATTLPGEILTRPQRPRNTLFWNRGDGTYAEIANYAGIEASEWSWSDVFLDVDLDGYEDVLVSTGHLWDIMDQDTRTRMNRMVGFEDWRRRLLHFPELPLRNLAFRNRGDLTFEEVGREWGFSAGEDISHGLALGDLDGDGDLDAVVNRLRQPALLMRNDATAPRIAVRLEGRPPNTRGIGSEILLHGGPVTEQRVEVERGGLYLSSSQAQRTFAASPGEDHRLVVNWPDGGRSVVEGVRPNRLYEVRQPGPASGGPSASGSPGRGQGPEEGSAPGEPVPVFQDVSHRLGHIHVERLYDDFRRQPLLPDRMSQLGPGVSWSDLEGDGDPDLLIGTGRGGTLSIFRNDGGSFTPVLLRMSEARYDQTTILPLPSADGGVGLAVGQSSYEAASAGAGRRARSVLRVRLDDGALARGTASPRVSELVGSSASSTGPLAQGDYDTDGDLDLFVGGRLRPGRYPAPATSRLMENRDGRFVEDGSAGGLLRDVGMVSGAVFSDVTGDGLPDLLLAREWGSLMLLVNEGGRFRDATEAYGLSGHLSRWNGVATGDLDGDGRLDIVATAWGENTEYDPTPEHPLRLYWGDFDANGTVDIVEARYDERLGAEAPLASLRRLRKGLPYLQRRVSSHAQYARLDLEEVIGSPLGEARRVEATSLAHRVFLNRGDHFEARKLPAVAQFAPAFHAGVADFDGDGHEDVFLAQNFFATDPEASRYDSGRGLWLKGDGTGGLRPVPGQRSGVAVYGGSRGAALADFDLDGRVDLAVSQNGAATKLYRNRGAEPGLRVRLEGPPGNPRAVGAVLRVVYEDGVGPAREVRAGSGYWSRDGSVQVMGLRGPPRAVRVRWPGGEVTEAPVPEGSDEVTVPGP